MTDDRVYPASKPPAAVNPSFPATKAQIYGANRPGVYRPPPGRSHRRHRRGCCCRCCCWTFFVITLLVLIVAAAAAVIYLIYRPQRPTFSVSSFKISALNLTSSNHLTTNISISVIAKNPNKNIGFFYDETAITVKNSEDDVIIGHGNFPAFFHGKKNTTLLKSTIGGPKENLDEVSAKQLKDKLKSKKGLPIKIVLDTKVKGKMGSIKSPKIRVRISCEGIKATAPTGKTAKTVSTSDVKCKVDLRFKIFNFVF